MRLSIEMSVEDSAAKLWAVRDAWARLTRPWAVLRSRMRRPAAARLADLPDHILQDIGLRRSEVGVELDARAFDGPVPGHAGRPGDRRPGRYAIATSGTARLSREETMWPASASISGDRSCHERASAISHMGSRGKPSASDRTRIPGRTADSGRTETARPAITAAPTPAEFQLAKSTL